jgi:iron complex outermembrane receptor protein
MKKEIRLRFLLFLFSPFVFCAQEDTVDLKEVTVNAYLGNRPLLRLPSSTALIDSEHIYRQPGISLVPVLNTIPGVRMEERSPGSYRLSIRGSLIRSPFGIRNTKIYLDEFPLTNAGGDSYLNLIDINSVNRIEVLKGPDGSLFGANSGGVVRVDPIDQSTDSSYASLGAGGGSYGLLQQNIKLQLRQKRNIFSVNESWQHSDGYRKNSALDRRFVQVSNRVNYSDDGHLRVYFFYSDLNYQTPGGLTLSQYKDDPRQARLPTKVLPSAVDQRARVRNRTFFGGVVNDVRITDNIRHVISVFGSQTFFENPFITNYEVRDEGNGGARTWLEFSNDEESGIRVKWNIGGEYQEMQSQISNYGNNLGVKDTIQASDNFNIRQAFGFTRLLIDIYSKWTLEVSCSYNTNRYTFSRLAPIQIAENKKAFDPQFMPRLSMSYFLFKALSIRAIVSRGYSPPTLQEIRPSNNIVNTSLQPESGWNYEGGIRLSAMDGRLWWDVSAFYYELKQAIIKRSDENGQDYFVNAGTTYQPGVESQLSLQLVETNNTKFIRGLQLTHAYTYMYFKFGNYANDLVNFSGKDLTGVPREISVTGISVNFPLNLYFFAQHNYTSRIPLNDLNSEYASHYDLVQLKAGWKFNGRRKFVLDLSAGVDNLLNERYSLGNDLNAVGNRYYNAAAPRNYFGKIIVVF